MSCSHVLALRTYLGYPLFLLNVGSFPPFTRGCLLHNPLICSCGALTSLHLSSNCRFRPTTDSIAQRNISAGARRSPGLFLIDHPTPAPLQPLSLISVCPHKSDVKRSPDESTDFARTRSKRSGEFPGSGARTRAHQVTRSPSRGSTWILLQMRFKRTWTLRRRQFDGKMRFTRKCG